MLKALLIALLLAAGLPSAAQPKLPTSPLVVESGGAKHRFVVEVADKEETRNTGMMFRTRLGKRQGMLFDYLEPRGGIKFWMKNTLIPLDIIFISPHGTIIKIATGVPHDETPIPAGEPCRAVLELAGGRAAALKLKAGDHVRHAIFGDKVR